MRFRRKGYLTLDFISDFPGLAHRLHMTQMLLVFYRWWSTHVPFRRGRGALLRAIGVMIRFGFAPPTVRTGDGFVLDFDPESTLLRTVLDSGDYCPDEVALLLRLTPAGGTFFDIGANVGRFTLPASRHVGRSGRVFAFEPAPAGRRQLERNVRRCGCQNVTVVPIACAAFEGSSRMTIEKDSGWNYLSPEARDGLVVPVQTLDGFVSAHGIDGIDTIKIDVEGAELEVLRGARETLARFRPVVYLEAELLDRWNTVPSDVTTLAEALDYRVSIRRNERDVRSMLWLPRERFSPGDELGSTVGLLS